MRTRNDRLYQARAARRSFEARVARTADRPIRNRRRGRTSATPGSPQRREITILCGSELTSPRRRDHTPRAVACWSQQPMMKAIDLRKGKLVNYEGTLYTVHTATHVAKGNKRSYIQAKLKDLKNGNLLDVRFNVDDRVETPFIDTKPYEYLYRDGDDFVLMDQTSYEQIHVSSDIMGDAAQYLKGNETVTCAMVDGKIVTAELPNVVELEVTDTPPVVKGATATNQNKDATLETGLRVKVPPFIGIGDVIRVDTRSGEYIERAKG
ncbi:MAG: elongation factor P [Planctomycetota bacterium]|nr:MAG: elongation factor P [Planctomycetota bacterium]